jgi:hypothetical protein
MGSFNIIRGYPIQCVLETESVKLPAKVASIHTNADYIGTILELSSLKMLKYNGTQFHGNITINNPTRQLI